MRIHRCRDRCACVRERSEGLGECKLKANAEIGDIAVGGGQTNFEHSSQQSYYPFSLEVTVKAAGKSPQTGKKLPHIELTKPTI